MTPDDNEIRKIAGSLTDAGKLRLLAAWFDMDDERSGRTSDEVQRSLRRIADDLDRPNTFTLRITYGEPIVAAMTNGGVVNLEAHEFGALFAVLRMVTADALDQTRQALPPENRTDFDRGVALGGLVNCQSHITVVDQDPKDPDL